MKQAGWIFVAMAFFGFAGAGVEPASALLLGPGGRVGTVLGNDVSADLLPVVDRLEMRSYQPRSGLQYGFRPPAPVQRGVRASRPKIVMPKRVAPLIGYGSAGPYSGQLYSYCADPPQPLEPREGPYAPSPVGPRQCP